MQKVSLVNCDEYELNQVKKAIDKSFENLGGIDKYIKPSETVLLKINLLMKKRPEEATTTHPVFVRALTEKLINHGAKVIIADSPGGPFNEKMLRGIYRVCGIEDVANQTGAKLNYDTRNIEVKVEDLKILNQITVMGIMKDVDKVISVSKLKTHGMALFTGAVKNMFGIIPGLLKAEYHFNMPDIVNFSDLLVDICKFANPVLSFMDGIVGMEGEGPSAGTPRKVKAVIASESPYHLDVIAASLIGINPIDVPTIKRCVERGICSGESSDIEIIGEEVERFIVKDFKVPNIKSVHFLKGILPTFIEKRINNLLQPKPIFNHEICIGCRDCAESCPAKTIDMVNNKPVVNMDNCIRCFCCQELCPKKAVAIYRPWILEKARKL